MKKSKLILMGLIPALLLVFFLSQNDLLAQTSGTCRMLGHLVDSETGEDIIGATVMIPSLNTGALTDMNGSFSINKLPEGTYTVVIKLIGYANVTVEEVVVKEDQPGHINIALKPEYIQGEDVEVTAKAVQNTEAALLSKREKSYSISDAISSETMSRTGSGNAGDAVKTVTGASVVGGNEVVIRGLGERYSSTQLNGTELPSADPDKRNFQIDLLPSNLLDNIEVTKSFTPDKQGNFSGGIVDLGTKDYPEILTMKVSIGSSYNSQVTNNENYLSYKSSSTDWRGSDDGSREIPTEILTAEEIPNYAQAITNKEKARELSRLSKSFNSTMAPTASSAPLNQSYAFSLGNETSLFGQRLGYLASISYKRDYSFYEDGYIARWRLSGNYATAESLTKDFILTDSEGSDDVLWGGLFTTKYQLHRNHNLNFNFLHTQGGTSESRFLYGHFYDGNMDSANVFQTRVLKYVERKLNSFQIGGEHLFTGLNNLNAQWTTSFNKNEQDEPDLRFFSNHYVITSTDTVYTIRPSLYTEPQRLYRNLDESTNAVDLKFTLPFKQWSGYSGNLKFGTYYSYKDREYRERVFKFINQDRNSYEGDAEAYFSDDNTGIIDSVNGRYVFGNYVTESSELRSNYNGDQTITALFMMVEMPLTRTLRFVGGARYETTEMNVETQDPNLDKGYINDKDVLPAASLILQVSKNMNLRSSYGKTLARPTMREMAPFPSYDFANGFFLIGNPDLKRTLIDNLDLRWEWFARPGEIIAASLFYKKFQNPIERAMKSDNGEIQYQNVDKSKVYGAEFEFRKGLDFLGTFFNNFQIGANLSLIHSEVDIPAEELAEIKAYDPNADDTRPLQGQSPYLLNFDLTYNNRNSGSMISLSLNSFGDRLSEVSLGGTPDIYEQSFTNMNLVFTQKIFNAFQLKFAAKNLLDAEVKKSHEFKGEEYIYQQYSKGRSFSLGLSYSL